MTDYYAQMRGVYASGRPWSWGWHLTSASAIGTVAAAWDTALNSMWTDATTGINTLFPTTTIWQDSLVTQLTSSLTFASRGAPIVRNLAGTNVNIGMPDEVSAVVSLRSPDLSKSGRGRSKFPAPAENEGSNGQLLPAAAARLSGGANLAFSSLAGASISPFVFNKNVTLSRPTAKTKTTITIVLASEKLGTVAERPEKTKAVFH